MDRITIEQEIAEVEAFMWNCNSRQTRLEFEEQLVRLKNKLASLH